MQPRQRTIRWSNTILRLRGFAFWFVTGLLLWWVLTEADPKGTGFGFIAATLTGLGGVAVASRWQHRLRVLAIPGFIFYFVRLSLIAGVDVARRTLHPKLPMAPQMIRVPIQLPAGAPRWLLGNTLSLLPGTLSVDIDDDHLLLHALDGKQPIAEQVADTERRIAALFAPERAT